MVLALKTRKVWAKVSNQDIAKKIRAIVRSVN